MKRATSTLYPPEKNGNSQKNKPPIKRLSSQFFLILYQSVFFSQINAKLCAMLMFLKANPVLVMVEIFGLVGKNGGVVPNYQFSVKKS